MFPKIIHMCEKRKDYIINADRWKILNPEYEIRLYDDIACINFLKESFNQKHVDIFNFIPDGAIKADFWRVCVLYIHGGVYSDADNVPLISLDEVIENVDLATCSSYWDRMRFNFNPNFIVAYPRDTIIKKCIDWYISKYENKSRYSYWDWSIMRCFTDIIKPMNYEKKDGIYDIENYGNIQILKECKAKKFCNDCNIYKGMQVFNNRSEEWMLSKATR